MIRNFVDFMSFAKQYTDPDLDQLYNESIRIQTQIQN